MSPTPNRSYALQHFECRNAIRIQQNNVRFPPETAIHTCSCSPIATFCSQAFPILATFPLPCSLVSRPFPPQAFDRLQYAKTEGEGLGERVTCMTSGTCRHEGAVPDRCNSNFLFDQPQIYQIMSCIDTVFRTLQSQVFGQDIRRRISRFFIRYRPPRVYQTSCM